MSSISESASLQEACCLYWLAANGAFQPAVLEADRSSLSVVTDSFYETIHHFFIYQLQPTTNVPFTAECI